MSISYGKKSYRVTPAMISTVNIDTTGRTSYAITEDSSGGAIVTVTMTSDPTNGCNSNNGFSIDILDVIPWNRMSCRFVSTGAASCWGWNGNNGSGAGLTRPTGNLFAYSAGSGDSTRNEFNVWDLPQFTKAFSACDNASTNYMHGTYQVGSSRGFDMFVRRNSMSLPAGPSHGRTCSGLGTVVVSNMFIMEY